jgi:AcrR family transcriptional regulator
MTAALRTPKTGVDRWVTEAALDLFDTHGYLAIDELDIALRAGITVGELRTRFVDRHEVLGTILDRATDALFWSRLEVDELAPLEALERLMREHLRLIAVDRKLSRVVAREHVHLENPYRRSWAVRTALYRERWVDAVTRLGWAQDEAQVAVIAVLYVLNAAADRDADPRGEDDLVAYALGFFTR